MTKNRARFRRRAGAIAPGRSTLLALVLLLLWALPARATLVMEIQAQARVSGPELAVQLKLRNRGDEKALELQAEVLYPGGGRPGRRVAGLDPGQSTTWRLRVPLPAGQGRGAVILRVRYHDGNRYPFSALSWAYYHQGPDRPGLLTLQGQPLELARMEQARLEIKNPGDRPLQLEALVFTPAELKARPLRQKIFLPARGRRELEFDLANLSGLPGSSYPVLVLLRYRLGRLETAQVAGVMVKLVPRQANFFRRHWWWLAGLVALFLAIFAWVQGSARRRRSP